MNPAQVKYMQHRFRTNPHWEELVQHEPRIEAALGRLPDERLIRQCNPCIRGMFNDAKHECGALARYTGLDVD